MDVPVEFLLEKVWSLVEYHYDLISNAKSELEALRDDLRTLKAILKTAGGKYKKDAVFMEWEKQVRETVYHVEDVIDTCITRISLEKKKNLVRRSLAKVNRSSLAEEVRSAGKKVQTLFVKQREEFIPNLTLSDKDDKSAAETREIRQKRRQNKIVGFDEEAKTVIGNLRQPSNKLEVLSIVGMPGLGKTTLAWKIFQDEDIIRGFTKRIWVNISDDLNLNKVLRDILGNFTSQVQVDNTPVDKLLDAVKDHLESIKFLLVMDDVWSTQAWDELKSFLPITSNIEARVLITSRYYNVGVHANLRGKPHQPKLLDAKKSWELLQYEVYGGDAVYEELEETGELIASNCDGLPLSIVVIGGVLKDKISDARGVVSEMKKQWDDVRARIQTYLIDGDKTKRLQKIIRLSYEKLPYELRDCFLYLGMFAEDDEIPTKKLTLLWIAEGFVQPVEGKSLEEVAHDYLKDLINRNLLIVKKEKTKGEAKICQVHDTIREFCRTEANFQNLNLFQEICWTKQGAFYPLLENVGKYRRISIHSYIPKFFLEKPKAPNARTFLCFTKSPIEIDAKEILEAFHLLRILDAENIMFPKFPPKIVQLIHLRYLTLTFSNDQTKFLPDVMSNLWNLQTLIVKTQSRTLEMEADIWIMRNLRHLKTKASIVLKIEGKGQGGDNLQTLDRLSPVSCTDAVFNKAKNLVSLGIQGDLSSSSEYSKYLKKLVRLNKLKLVHAVQNGEVLSENPLPCLPEASKFPPNLKILVLTSTYLNWQHMSVLENLVFLEELKLKENAFTGNSWKAGTGGFKCLEILDIERADIVFWTASEDSFPQLKFLLLKNCEKLKAVPFDISKKLEMLCLDCVTTSAVSSAEDIAKTKGLDFVLKISSGGKN